MNVELRNKGAGLVVDLFLKHFDEAAEVVINESGLVHDCEGSTNEAELLLLGHVREAAACTMDPARFEAAARGFIEKALSRFDVEMAGELREFVNSSPRARHRNDEIAELLRDLVKSLVER